jgi:urease gamma subunit
VGARELQRLGQRETARLLVLAAADVAARESERGRRLPAAREALLGLIPG